MAVPVGRISQGAAVFCVRNASIARVVRSMPSRSTSRHFCDATRCRRRCSTTISTSAGSSRRRRSGASARNGDANALHARLRRDGSSVVSVALEPTACSSARLELPPEVVSGSVLVASAQFVGARCFDVAAPRFEARPSRRRRRKDEELLGAFGPATWTLPQSRCRRWSCRSDGAYVITRLLLTQDRRAYSSKMPSRHFNKWAIEQGPKARPSKPR